MYFWREKADDFLVWVEIEIGELCVRCLLRLGQADKGVHKGQAVCVS